VTDILIVGDTQHSAELRHEIPVDIGDTFLYAEVGGRRVSIVWSIEGDRIEAVDPSIEIVHSETFPIDDLLREGVDFYALAPANIVRQVASLGLRSARVPGAFPLRFADALRAAGVELVVDQRLFDDRRRRKTSFELEGIHRASRAAEAGTAAIAALLARSEPGDGGRVVDGQPLTCEALRETAVAVFGAAGCRGDDLIAAAGPQSATRSARAGSRTTT
jgi:Xaa-Pro aminopeptidase